MKRIFYLFIAILFVFSLVACNSLTAEPIPTPTPEATPTVTPEPPIELPLTEKPGLPVMKPENLISSFQSINHRCYPR